MRTGPKSERVSDGLRVEIKEGDYFAIKCGHIRIVTKAPEVIEKRQKNQKSAKGLELIEKLKRVFKSKLEIGPEVLCERNEREREREK
jgi:hypothetical protein